MSQKPLQSQEKLVIYILFRENLISTVWPVIQEQSLGQDYIEARMEGSRKGG
jgi:hypothetical protein